MIHPKHYSLGMFSFSWNELSVCLVFTPNGRKCWKTQSLFGALIVSFDLACWIFCRSPNAGVGEPIFTEPNFRALEHFKIIRMGYKKTFWQWCLIGLVCVDVGCGAFLLLSHRACKAWGPQSKTTCKYDQMQVWKWFVKLGCPWGGVGDQQWRSITGLKLGTCEDLQKEAWDYNTPLKGCRPLITSAKYGRGPLIVLTAHMLGSRLGVQSLSF